MGQVQSHQHIYPVFGRNQACENLLPGRIKLRDFCNVFSFCQGHCRRRAFQKWKHGIEEFPIHNVTQKLNSIGPLAGIRRKYTPPGSLHSAGLIMDGQNSDDIFKSQFFFLSQMFYGQVPEFSLGLLSYVFPHGKVCIAVIQAFLCKHQYVKFPDIKSS